MIFKKNTKNKLTYKILKIKIGFYMILKKLYKEKNTSLKDIKMNNIYRNILGGLTIASAFGLAASDILSSDLKEVKKSKNHVSLGIEGAHYHYKEPSLMKMTAFPMLGVNGSYTYNIFPMSDLSLDGRYQYGKAKYSSNGTGKIGNKIDNHLFETRILAGMTFFENKSVKSGLYTGLGYRFKSDYMDGKKSSTGHMGYDRTSQYFYLPLGLQLSLQHSPEWKSQFKIEYDHLLRGTQKSEITIESKKYSVTNKQKKGYGLKGEYLVSYKNVSFGPYAHYWDIKDSDYVTKGGGCWMEPHNKTTELGLKLTYSF